MALQTFLINKGVLTDIPAIDLPDGYASDTEGFRFISDTAEIISPVKNAIYWAANLGNKITGLYAWLYNSNIYILVGTKNAMYLIVNGGMLTLSTSYKGFDTQTPTQDATPWSFTAFGDIILFTNGIDPIQYVLPQQGYLLAHPLNSDSVASPPNNSGFDIPIANVIKTFQRHLITLGINSYPNPSAANTDTVDINKDVAWSNIDDYTNFDITDLVPEGSEAGNITCYESNTPIIGGDSLGGNLFAAYSRSMIFTFQYIGSPYVFQRNIAAYNVGLWYRNLLATTQYKQYFMSEDNFYAFDGLNIEPIGEGIKYWLWSILDKTQMSAAFAFTNVADKEIWFVVPTGSSGNPPNLACIYNYEMKAWSFLNLTAHSGCDLFSLSKPIIPNMQYTALIGEQSIYALQEPLEYIPSTAPVASTGYGNCFIDTKEFGDPIQEKRLNAVIIDAQAISPYAIQIGYRDSLNSQITWSPSYIYGVSDQKLNLRVSTKFFRVRVLPAQNDETFNLVKVTVDYDIMGER